MTPALSVYLDLMRLLAAGMVLAYHMTSRRLTGGLLWRVGGHGTEAVMAFFVLSGFVISYVTARREPSAHAYVVARMARIYSVAVIAVPVTLLADAIGMHLAPALYQGRPFFNPDTNWRDVLQSLTFVNELWFNHVIIGSDEPFWSLGFEVWYYAVFGVLLFAAGRVRIVLAAVLMVIAGPKIMLYFPLWLLGVATFRLIGKRRSAGRPLLSPRVGAAVFVLTPALYLLLHAYRLTAPVTIFGPKFTFDGPTALTWAYYAGVASLFAAHLVGFAALPPAATRVAERCGPVIRWAAGASFTLYLVHYPLIYCFAAISPWPRDSLPNLLFIGLGTIVVVLAVAELGERRKRVWQRAIGGAMGLLGRSMSRRPALKGLDL